MSEIAVIDRPLTAVEVKAQVQAIQEIMTAVMIEGVHYGKIPGCPQPSLFKPGAEKLLVTFGVAVTPDVEDLSTPDCFRYRVTARAVSRSGLNLGAGCGEASTDEDKYKFRSAVCPEEFEATPENRKRIKWGKGQGGKAYEVKQIRTNPADLANTVLKMAIKRALVALSLQIFAASDIFAQDLEDLDPELYQTSPPAGKPATEPPQAREQKPGAITPGQVRMIKARLVAAKIAPADFCKRFKVNEVDEIPIEQKDAALDLIANWKAGE